MTSPFLETMAVEPVAPKISNPIMFTCGLAATVATVNVAFAPPVLIVIASPAVYPFPELYNVIDCMTPARATIFTAKPVPVPPVVATLFAVVYPVPPESVEVL